MMTIIDVFKRCFHEKIESHPESVLNIKPFIINCNWEGINYLSPIEDLKRFEKNSLRIALNVLYIKEKEICPVYISKIKL